MTSTRYDKIGTTYTRTRRTDPRVAAQVLAALGDARRVVNIGAGAGSYEPSDRDVVAVEPSPTMIAQRPAHAAPVVRVVRGVLAVPRRDVRCGVGDLHGASLARYEPGAGRACRASRRAR